MHLDGITTPIMIPSVQCVQLLFYNELEKARLLVVEVINSQWHIR